MRDNGAIAHGVDLNSSMLNLCRQQGLEVVQADVLEYLRSLGDARQTFVGLWVRQLIEGKPIEVWGGKQLRDFTEETYLGIGRSRLEFFNTNAPRSAPLQANIDYIFQSISEIDSLLKSRNIKLLVAIFPDEIQVNEAVLKSVLERFKLRPEDYDLEYAQSLLKTFLQTKDIPCVDLLDRFRAEGKTRELYLLRDTHWNKASNQLAAEAAFGCPRACLLVTSAQ